MKRIICFLIAAVFVLMACPVVFADNNNSAKPGIISGNKVLPIYADQCEQAGTVKTYYCQYETGWLTGELMPDDVPVDVYLPYGYTKDKQYNFVLVLLPTDKYDKEARHNEFMSYINTYDWLIADGKCEPFIAASIDLPNDNNEMGYRFLAYNIRNYLLPFISESFSVYADPNDEFEGWMHNRAHSAVYGLGVGAVFAYQSCMYWNIDMFGSYYFGEFGNKLNGSSIGKIIKEEDKYPVCNFICGDVKEAKNYTNSKLVYERVVERASNILTEGESAYFAEYSYDTGDDACTVLPYLFKDNAVSYIKDTHTHVIKDGKCIICGSDPKFYDDNLPRRFHFTCPQQGTVETFTYQTKDYWYKNAELEKEGMVYLPYGYDEDEKYNVMILLHGHTLNMHAFMDSVMGFDYGVRVQYKNDYDWIFYENLCRPCIIVTLNTPAEGYHQFRDMQYELRYDVLPYIANNFATYAKDGSDESLIAARDHFGLGGSSNGAGFTHGGSIYSNMAYFGSVLMMSGGMNYTHQTKNILDGLEQGYKLNAFIRACGSLDPLYEGVEYGYRYVANHVDYLEKGKNIFFFEVKQGHNGRVGYTAVVNAFQVLFPPMEDEMDIAAFKATEKIRNKLGLNNFLMENSTDE